MLENKEQQKLINWLAEFFPRTNNYSRKYKIATLAIYTI